jgi:hypothetical protein
MQQTQSVLNVAVSVFKDYYDSTPIATANLLKWLKNERGREVVEEIRQTADKKKRDKIKATLPAITPSGVFRKREAAELVQHSGIICIDVDHKGNEQIGNFFELGTELSKIQNVAYSGLSVSGKGYMLMIPVAYPQKHKEHFAQLEKDFQELGIKIDPACKDVSRLRGLSYDPNAYFNHNAVVYRKKYKPERRKNSPAPAVKNSPGDTVQKFIEIIKQTNIDITMDEPDWFRISCAFANEFGETGRDYFHQVSQFHSGYDSRETDRKYDRALKSRYRYGIGTFIKVCRDYGIDIYAKS